MSLDEQRAAEASLVSSGNANPTTNEILDAAAAMYPAALVARRMDYANAVQSLYATETHLVVGGVGGVLFGGGPGLLAPEVGGRVWLPFGAPALQDVSLLGLRGQAAAGQMVFRGGNFGPSAAAEGQFWSFESALTPGFASRIGAKTLGSGTPDFVLGATVRPGANFVTRFAPRFGSNAGGAPELVVNPGGMQLKYFHMPD